MTKAQEEIEKLFDILKKTNVELKALDAAPESSKEQDTKEDQTFDCYVKVGFEYEKGTRRIKCTSVKIEKMSTVGVLCAALTLLDNVKVNLTQTGSDMNDIMVWLHNLGAEDK
nr:MAG TPA: hypothetical protein [Caudoviricetes sp.]